jgi:hypothetical protein
MTRNLVVVSCCAVALAAIGCSGGASPSSPSSAVATITGTVVVTPSSATPSSLTVGVSGTTLSAAVEGSGNFRLAGVPTGDVQVTFRGSGTTSTVPVADVAADEVIELQVAIAGGTATLVNALRGGQDKILICHRISDTKYDLTSINTNTEAIHRAHGDAKPGEPVPADPTKVFDRNCELVSPVGITKSTNGEDANLAPGPTVAIGAAVTWTYVVTNNSAAAFSSLSVTDDKGVAVACPRELPAPGASITCTGSGTAAVGQYRNVGTVTITQNGNQFTASDPSHYFGGQIQGVTIKKFTNGQDADDAPGPTIRIGDAVTWTYVVTNRSPSTFSSLSVTDDRGVAVACPRELPPPGASITCTGSGTAVAGQYRNVGTVTATGSAMQFTASDASHYFGATIQVEAKVQLCHRTGNGSYHMIEVSVSAEPAHRGHGDAKAGEAVPGSPGQVFTADCGVR